MSVGAELFGAPRWRRGGQRSVWNALALGALLIGLLTVLAGSTTLPRDFGSAGLAAGSSVAEADAVPKAEALAQDAAAEREPAREILPGAVASDPALRWFALGMIAFGALAMLIATLGFIVIVRRTAPRHVLPRQSNSSRPGISPGSSRLD